MHVVQSLENEDVTSPIPALLASRLAGMSAAASKEPAKHDDAPPAEKGTNVPLALCMTTVSAVCTTTLDTGCITTLIVVFVTSLFAVCITALLAVCITALM